MVAEMLVGADVAGGGEGDAARDVEIEDVDLEKEGR